MNVRVVVSLEGGTLNALALRSTKVEAQALAREWAGDMVEDPGGGKWENEDDEVLILESIEVDGTAY